MNGLYTDGRWQPASGAIIRATCPASGEIVYEGAGAAPVDVGHAVASARRAFSSWSRRPVDERITILESYARELSVRAEPIAQAISRDMGKALWDSSAEAASMQAKIAVSISAMRERAGLIMQAAAFGEARLAHRPHGVMAVFGPFNFPGHLPNGHIVPALLAGNTCVFKPSELAPSVAILIAEAFEAAGLPEGCLNIVQGARDTGAALLGEAIDGVLFTGSAETGIAFHRYFAGRPEVILALEMGGNNPLILWDAADVSAAGDIAVQSAFLTTGQRCSCARRIILPEGRWGDSVLDAIIERTKSLPIGAWNDPGIFMGPLVSAQAASRAVRFQERLQAAGGEILLQLSTMQRGEAFVSPGVVEMTRAADFPDEELFGPLMQVFRAPDFEAAIRLANATRFGLSAGLVSDDDHLWEKAQAEVRAGILNRNRLTAGASAAMPFGGPGLSGNFRPGGYYAADYCAWPQASQIAPRAVPLPAPGF